MIVVLEGPDFAGKSTLAETLQERFNGRILSNGQPPAGVDLSHHYLQQVIGASGRSELTVFDRLHVGELIYGPIYRGRCLLSVVDVEEIERALDKDGALKLHVDAPDEVLVERFRCPRGDDLVEGEERLISIAREYRRILGSPDHLLNWQNLDASAVVSRIQESLPRRE